MSEHRVRKLRVRSAIGPTQQIIQIAFKIDEWPHTPGEMFRNQPVDIPFQGEEQDTCDQIPSTSNRPVPTPEIDKAEVVHAGRPHADMLEPNKRTLTPSAHSLTHWQVRVASRYHRAINVDARFVIIG
jgi:hypothetical protein